MKQGKSAAARLIQRARGFRYTLVWEGVAVGAAAGAVTVLFRLLLARAEELRQALGEALAGRPWLLAVWLAALLALAGVVTLLLRWEPLIGGSGIPQVEGEVQGALSQTWWRVLLAKFLGGVLSVGAGLSLGREGPSIQLGAMAGKGVSRLWKRDATEEKLLLTCGASAGLSAAFNAPLAGVLFSLEELHKDFSTDVLLSAMASSVTADFISRTLFGLGPVFTFPELSVMPLGQYWMVLLLGVVLGLAGAFYNLCVAKSQDLYAKIPWPYVRAAVPFLLAGVLLAVCPAVLGGGHQLVEAVSQERALSLLLGLFAAKFLFSMVSFGAGVPGGIFLPLLVLGALVGSAFSQGAHMLGLQAGVGDFVILGMAGMFAAIVRSPVTGIVLISEMTGSFSHLLALSLVSLAAYVTADLLRSPPVYEMLLARLLKKRPAGEAPEGKVLLCSTVSLGAPACGKAVHQLALPGGALMVAVQRQGQELLPHGDTVLQAGDVVSLLCEERESRRAYGALKRLCKR